ncbi:hypothetical protein [Streptomyces typhae]|uniref:hypothetical protein n=1 Tax=Streptomyces typhae TaxID=2681492 RepID=UPI0012F6FDFD|nr:hypothetical protein [Streptomyces typhae]
MEAIDGLFGILDEGDLPADTADFSNGLVAVMTAGALIATGVAFGPVRVQTLTSLEPPPAADSQDEWEEIIEVTVQAPTGRLRAHSLEDSRYPRLPALSTQGSGPYRVRVHARGRAGAPSQADGDPVEDYLLQVWPAGTDRDTIILRGSERIERALREPWPTEHAPGLRTTDEEDELCVRLLRGGGSNPLSEPGRGNG